MRQQPSMFQPTDSKHWAVATASSQISYEGKRFLSLLGLTRRDNERRGMHVLWLSQGRFKFVLLSNSYVFVCYFICICFYIKAKVLLSQA